MVAEYGCVNCVNHRKSSRMGRNVWIRKNRCVRRSSIGAPVNVAHSRPHRAIIREDRWISETDCCYARHWTNWNLQFATAVNNRDNSKPQVRGSATSILDDLAPRDCHAFGPLNPLTPELNTSARRCLTKFFTGDFAWTVHFVIICMKFQQIRQLFIVF
jgi:hypothetical protein